jgi:hypothetical protein
MQYRSVHETHDGKDRFAPISAQNADDPSFEEVGQPCCSRTAVVEVVVVLEVGDAVVLVELRVVEVLDNGVIGAGVPRDPSLTFDGKTAMTTPAIVRIRMVAASCGTR